MTKETNESDEFFETGFTSYLRRWQKGDAKAYQKLFLLVFKEIRRLASRELMKRRANHSWHTTDLANEIVVRLLKRDNKDWKDKEHFLNTAALAMFQILIDYGRKRGRAVTGQQRVDVQDLENQELQEESQGPFGKGQIDVDKMIDLRNAIKKLALTNQRMAAITVMRLNFGMNSKEIAAQLGIAVNTVNNLWPRCKKFLALELKGWRMEKTG